MKIQLKTDTIILEIKFTAFFHEVNILKLMRLSAKIFKFYIISANKIYLNIM